MPRCALGVVVAEVVAELAADDQLLQERVDRLRIRRILATDMAADIITDIRRRGRACPWKCDATVPIVLGTHRAMLLPELLALEHDPLRRELPEVEVGAEPRERPGLVRVVALLVVLQPACQERVGAAPAESLERGILPWGEPLHFGHVGALGEDAGEEGVPLDGGGGGA